MLRRMIKQLVSASALLLSFTTFALSQNAGNADAPSPATAPADPFLKEKGKKANEGDPAGAQASVVNVGVVFQYIDVTRERWQQWLAANDAPLDATALRKEVETWIAAGEATLAESSLVMGKSGARSKVESVRFLIYPHGFTDEAGDQPFVTSVECRNVGTTAEVDPLLSVDGGVELNFAPERVSYAGEAPPRDEPGVQDGDIRFPLLKLQKATASITLDPQEWGIIGSESSLENPDTHQTLIFVRPVLHRYEEKSEKAAVRGEGALTFTWLEVGHEAFNASLMKGTDLSGWVGGGLHEELRKVGAAVIEERVTRFRSGQRHKNESIEEVMYPTEFNPSEKSPFSTPAALETRNVGTSLEFDPVLSENGATLDLNMAPQISFHVGWDVLHRVFVGGEWKPNVTMAAVYWMNPTTQLSLPMDVPVLVAVMSPHDERGWTDPARKVLLFVKVSR